MRPNCPAFNEVETRHENLKGVNVMELLDHVRRCVE